LDFRVIYDKIMLMSEIMPEKLTSQDEEAEPKKPDSAAEDDLTGLPTRAPFESALNLLIKGRKAGKVLLVMFLDLNYFKEVNDKLGHGVGDDLLIAVANVLKEEPGIVCRNGGDEFTLAREGEALDGESVVLVVEGIRAKINEALRDVEALRDAKFREVTVAIGCAVSRGEGKSRKDLMKEADLEMYADKRKQKATEPVTAQKLEKVLYPSGNSNN